MKSARLVLGTIIVAVGLMAFAAPAMAVQYADDTGKVVGGCTSPNDPCELQYAINGSSLGEEIRIGGGLYDDTNYASTSGNSLVYENFQNGADTTGEAIISSPNAGVALMLTTQPTVTSYTVRGLTVRGDGGAIVASNDQPAAMTVSISDSRFDGEGGTGARINLQSLVGDGPISATVERNVFEETGLDVNDNARAMTVSTDGGKQINVTVRDNKFSGFTDSIVGQNGTATVTGNTITNAYDDVAANTRSAIRLAGTLDATVNDNTIVANPAMPVETGINLSENAAPSASTIRRTSIVGVHARALQATGSNNGSLLVEDSLLNGLGEGGGTLDEAVDFVNYPSVTLRGVTIPDAQFLAKSLSMNNTDVVIDSSILEDPIIDVISTCAITNSRGPAVTPDECDNFQTTAAPQFVNAAASDYRLAPTSTLIDAGNPAFPGATDLLRATRSQDGNADGIAVRDMGAYELADTFAPTAKITTAPPATTTVTIKKPKKKKGKKKKKKKKKAKAPSATLSIGFSATDDPAAKFECSLDGAAFTACTSPVAASVGAGSHTFSVQGIDALGNKQATPATTTFAVVAKKAKKKKKKK